VSEVESLVMFHVVEFPQPTPNQEKESIANAAAAGLRVEYFDMVLDDGTAVRAQRIYAPMSEQVVDKETKGGEA
jgi:hypothetical protein